MKRISILFISLLLGMVLKAQSGVVKGRITDADNIALPGATIMIVDTDRGTITDVDGFFTLTNVDEGTSTIRVSYLGYKELTQELQVVSNQTMELNFEMVSGIELGEVVVRGNLPGQARALNYQKESVNILNVISSDQVDQFPDANIGDAMKRISGINVQYDQGEARFANIRGTAPELSSVTINGDRIPSAEAEVRSVQLDLVPSEMIQTIEVHKVITPDMDADAIGGSVNLVTRATPSGRRINGQVGTGYNWISGKPQWKGSILYADRFAEDKIGITLSASVFDHKLGSDNHEAEWERDDDDGSTMLKEFQIRQYYLQRLRQSYSAAIDYNINNNHRITLKGMYNQRDDWENRYRTVYKDMDEYESDTAVIERQTKAGVNGNKYGRLEKQKTYNASLSGDHIFGKVQVDWHAAYNKASEERPNERYIQMVVEDAPVAFDISDPGKVKIAADPEIGDLNSNYKLDEFTEANQLTEEENIVARLNLKIPLRYGKFANSIKIGGAYLAKDKMRDNDFYEFSPLDEDAFLTDALNNIEDQSKSDFMAGDYQIGSFVKKEFVGDQNLNDATRFEKEIDLSEYAGNYEATENIVAGYLRFDQKIGNELDLIAGVRVEQTTNEYSGHVYNDDEETLEKTEKESKSYTDVLPSLILRYRLAKNTNIKAAWTNTISRPRYFDLVPYAEIEDDEMAIGNPELKPTQSMNLDLLGEMYFESIGVISAGVFYKKITDHMVDRIYEEGDFEVTQTINGMDAKLLGFEIAAQRQLDFLPSFLKYFGVYANYTYTSSEATNFELEDREDEKVPLSGSPEHMLNASLSFDTDKLSLRLSYNFASEFVDEFGDVAFEDVYYDKVSYLDFNVNYQFAEQFNAYLKVNNILNQPLRYYQGEKDYTYQAEYYGMTVALGVGFKF